MNDERKTETDMEMDERKENNYWNVAYAISTGYAGFLPGNADTGANPIHSNSRGSSRRSWRHTQRNQNKSGAANYENKTEREINSLIKRRVSINIAINKIVEFIKKWYHGKNRKSAGNNIGNRQQSS